MAKKPTVTTVATGYYGRQALNTNFENIQEAFDNTLSRDGSTPNQMEADIDLNGNDLLNVGTIDVENLSISGVGIPDLDELVEISATIEGQIDTIEGLADGIEQQVDEVEAYLDLGSVISTTDGAANRTFLTTMAASGLQVDLMGLDILVDTIPVGNFKNGSFRDSTGISYPTRGLFSVSSEALPKGGDPVQTQFQGNGHYDERGRSIEIHTASGYLDADLNLVQYRSTDHGKSWYRREELTPDNVVRHSFYPTASWTYGGRTNLLDQGRASEGDEVQWFSKLQPYIEAQVVTVSTTSGTNDVVVTFENHGIASIGWNLPTQYLDVIKFAELDGANAGIGGIAIGDILGTRQALYQGDKDTVRIEAGATATSTVSETRIVTFQAPTRNFEPMLFDGATDSFEQALLDQVAGLTDLTIVQGITHDSEVPVAAISGNIKCLVQMPDGVTVDQTITKLAEFSRTSGDAGGVLTEPSIASDPDNPDLVFGFLRTQNPLTELPNFWWSTNRGVTIAGQNEISVPDGYALTFLNRSPIPCALGADRKIYGMATDRLTVGTGIQGNAGIYLLVADIDEAFTTGGPAFTIYKVGEMLITARAGTAASGLSSEASQVGRPTVIKEGPLLHFFYESEVPLDVEFYDNGDQAEVNCVRFTIDTNTSIVTDLSAAVSNPDVTVPGAYADWRVDHAALTVTASSVSETALPATNDSRFTTFETTHEEEIIDLKGLELPVTSVPTGNKYKNGFYELTNFDEGLTALLPAPDTLKVNTVMLTANEYYESWPQDKTFLWKPKGPANINSEEVLHAVWCTGGGHGNTDMSTAMMRGTPKKMGPRTERFWQRYVSSTHTGGSSWGAGELDGQMLVIEREKDNTGTTTDHHLWGRRLHENRIAQVVDVSTANASAVVTVAFKGNNDGDKHGLKVGDRLSFAGMSAVGGITLSGTYDVTSVVDANTITVTHGAPASSTAGPTEVTSTRVIFFEDQFTELTVDGGAGAVSLSDALADFDAVNWPNPVTEMHSFHKVPGEDSFWFGIHGGSGNATGAWIVKVENVFTAPTITAVEEVGPGIELTIWHIDDNGKLYGAIRHQSDASPLTIYTFDPDTTTATINDFYSNGFAVKCVMSGDEWNGKLVATVNGTRGLTDSTPPGPVGLYTFIWDSLADFETNGFDNAKAYHIGTDNWQADTFSGTDTSAVGVSSSVVTENGVICIVGAQENPNTWYDRDGQPDIVVRYVYGLLADEPYEGAWGSWSSQYANEPMKEPDFYQIAGKYASGGSASIVTRYSGPRTITYTNSGTGVYDVVFVDRNGDAMDIDSAAYFVTATTAGGNFWCRIQGRTASGFSVLTFDTTDTAANAEVYLKIEYAPIQSPLV